MGEGCACTCVLYDWFRLSAHTHITSIYVIIHTHPYTHTNQCQRRQAQDEKVERLEGALQEKKAAAEVSQEELGRHNGWDFVCVGDGGETSV